MTKVISNRFSELLAIKSRQEKRRISQRDVARVLNVSNNTIDSWAKNNVTRFDAPVLLALCEYLDCEVGDLLVIEEREDSTPEMQTERIPA